jgi:hypothetical protein
MPGLGIDVEEVAMLAARLALQTLSLRIPGGIGYPAAAADHVCGPHAGTGRSMARCKLAPSGFLATPSALCAVGLA